MESATLNIILTVYIVALPIVSFLVLRSVLRTILAVVIILLIELLIYYLIIKAFPEESVLTLLSIGLPGNIPGLEQNKQKASVKFLLIFLIVATIVPTLVLMLLRPSPQSSATVVPTLTNMNKVVAQAGGTLRKLLKGRL